jgi:hypothetical protein
MSDGKQLLYRTSSSYHIDMGDFDYPYYDSVVLLINHENDHEEHLGWITPLKRKSWSGKNRFLIKTYRNEKRTVTEDDLYTSIIDMFVY